MNFLRVNALPATPQNQTVYFVLDGADVRQYVVGFDGIARELVAEAGAVAWGDILGKPTFATVATTGAYADLTGIPSTFTPSTHNQAWSTITATPTTLSGYGITDAAAAVHTHTASAITDFASAVASNAAVAANTAKVTNATHTGEVTGSTALTIATGAVTLSKMASLATGTIIGRATAGTGVPEALTAAQVRTLLNVADGATANATDASLRDRATHTGTQAVATVTGLQAALDGKQPLATVLTNTTAAFTTAQETKLAGIATGATANDTNAALRDRATHTGTQPQSSIVLAGDLAAIEALTGTNNIYYRSAVDTWSAVTIGANLTFTGGTLAASGGGGATNLSYDAATRTVASDTGTDATLTLADGTNAGLMTAANFTKLGAITGANTGDQTSIVGITGTKSQFNAAVTDGDILYAGDVTSNATHTGDVTGATALTIANDAVTYAKMQNAGANTVLARAAATPGDIGEIALAAAQLLGRGATGDVAAITLGTNLSMTGATLNATGGGGGSVAWVDITGLPEDNADLTDLIDLKITTGISSSSRAVDSIAANISFGSGLSFTGAGEPGSPFIVTAPGGGGGASPIISWMI
jgi:hypothetical protein